MQVSLFLSHNHVIGHLIIVLKMSLCKCAGKTLYVHTHEFIPTYKTWKWDHVLGIVSSCNTVTGLCTVNLGKPFVLHANNA